MPYYQANWWHKGGIEYVKLNELIGAGSTLLQAWLMKTSVSPSYASTPTIETLTADFRWRLAQASPYLASILLDAVLIHYELTHDRGHQVPGPGGYTSGDLTLLERMRHAEENAAARTKELALMQAQVTQMTSLVPAFQKDASSQHKAYTSLLREVQALRRELQMELAPRLATERANAVLDG